jgi:hypothetical protein
MHRRIQETKQFMMNLTDNQLEMTTKRTIMENEQMSAEVAYQSRQTSALVGQNCVLDTRVAELKQALALSRDTQDELAKRNTIYQSTIKQLVRVFSVAPSHLEKLASKHSASLTSCLLLQLQDKSCFVIFRRGQLTSAAAAKRLSNVLLSTHVQNRWFALSFDHFKLQELLDARPSCLT